VKYIKFGGKLEKTNGGDLDINVTTTYKWILKKYGVKHGLDGSGWYLLVAGTYEYGNGH
jgi:hypothetical protein